MSEGVDVPAGCVRVTVGDVDVVALAAHADDARRMLANAPSLYDAAAREPGARALHGRGVAYAMALPASRTRAVVRHNRHGGLLAPVTRDLFLPPTRAPHELAISLRLHALGVPTAEVLMYGTSPAPFALRRADVVTREIEDGRDLSTFMSRETSEGERAEAWQATQALLRTMHRAGARHHDLNVKNVLLARRDGALTAYLLDVDRVELGAAGADRIAAANVARLLRSARKWRDERGAVFDERMLVHAAEPARAT